MAEALRQEIERIRERERSGRGDHDDRSGEAVPITDGRLRTGPRHLTEPLARGDERSGQRASKPVAESAAPRTAPPLRRWPTGASRQPSRHRPARPLRQYALAIATVGSTGGVTALIRSPLARRMLEVVLAEPVLLSPEERYLHGHYLAYLLSGSRRRGLFLRRPLEPRNADRGRLLLGLTYAILAGGGEEAIREAATLLDQRIEVRSILSPIVVAKYLACRESPAKRKLFRQTRKALGQASTTPRNACSTPRACSTPA